MQGSRQLLHRKLILIVEADTFQAGYLEAVLRREGANVFGPVADGDAALALLARSRTMPNAAVVGADVGNALIRSAGDWGLPLVLIGTSTDDAQARPHRCEIVPRAHAGFQVVDALVQLLGA